MNDGLPIKTERLTLRRLGEGDGDAMFEIYGNDENARYDSHPAWSAEQVVNLIQCQLEFSCGDPGMPFVLVAIESGRLVGAVNMTINSVDDRQGEFGYSFHHDFTGRGLATEAVNAALGYAFSVMGLHRMFAAVDTRNERSWKLMERIGMRREAHFVHANLEGEKWIDDYT